MIQGIASAGRPNPALSAEEAKLRDAAAQMEGVFMTHLLRALRETKPEGGLIDGGAGEDMFTGMMDDHLAQVAAAGQSNGLGATLFRQLRDRFMGTAETTLPPPPQPGSAAAAAVAHNGAGTVR